MTHLGHDVSWKFSNFLTQETDRIERKGILKTERSLRLVRQFHILNRSIYFFVEIIVDGVDCIWTVNQIYTP